MITFGNAKLFTLKETADKFHITTYTLRRYLHEGKLAGQKMGRSWYISESAIEQFFLTPYQPRAKRPKDQK